ncbi:MAG: tetratricopeptide repeat protein, partial [Spirochaetes bacterium]|nr:tetratricopeptide repeat protein [Spirochaetota bacterium]
DKYQVYLKLCEKYSDEFIDIQDMLGKIYYGQNDYKKAGKYFLNMIKIDPDNSQAFYYYGMSCLKQNQFLLSLKYLEKAYNKGLKSMELYKALAFSLYKLNRIYESVLYIEEAISIYKNNKSLEETLEYYHKIME